MVDWDKQRCQAISEAHQIAVDLVDDIVSMLPVPDMLRGRTQEPETRKQLMDFLELIKDTMNVLTQYAAHSTSSASLSGLLNTSLLKVLRFLFTQLVRLKTRYFRSAQAAA